MKLPILGIIIVIFLQLGFTAYHALDRPMESISFVKAVTVGSNPVAAMPDDSITAAEYYVNDRPRFRNAKNIDLITSAAAMRKSRRPVGVVFTNTVIKIPAAKPHMFQFVAMQKPEESNTIKCSQPVHPGTGSESFYPKADRSSEKRSFVAKSVSVVKKPYDWIKAIGSKFN